MTAFDRSNILNSVVEDYKNSSFVRELAFTLMVTIVSYTVDHKSPNMTTGTSVELESELAAILTRVPLLLVLVMP